jgi:hypothetical protein
MSMDRQAGGDGAPDRIYDHEAAFDDGAHGGPPSTPRRRDQAAADGRRGEPRPGTVRRPSGPAPDAATGSTGPVPAWPPATPVDDGRPVRSAPAEVAGPRTPPWGQPASGGAVPGGWAPGLPPPDGRPTGPFPVPVEPRRTPQWGGAIASPDPMVPLVKPVPGRRRAEARAAARRPTFRRAGRLADRIGFWRRLRSVTEIVFMTAVLGVLLAGVVAVIVGSIVLALQKALH